MFDGLPEDCLSTLPSSGTLILIKRGEKGYYPFSWESGDVARNREIADNYNRQRNISSAQEQAMLVGSMMGWNFPGADPRRYEEAQTVNGYRVLDRCRVGKNEIVLAFDPQAVQPYVTWRASAHSNYQDMYWGHYFTESSDAAGDYQQRIAEERLSLQERQESHPLPGPKKERGEER
ncbi:MAG: hypothetical protein Q4B48_08080 [Syntrophomonadaceae bacterium]|nr:hypothetical protein [Syntrophomonadaceae bacterium]